MASATSLTRRYTWGSTYTRVLNFGHFFHFLTAKREGRLICGSTCTCVHTVDGFRAVKSSSCCCSSLNKRAFVCVLQGNVVVRLVMLKSPTLWHQQQLVNLPPHLASQQCVHSTVSLGIWLWSPYVIGQTIIFLPCDFFLSVFFFFLA